MTLPTKTKTWTIRKVSIPVSASVAECNKRWLWEWKNSMVALGATVTGSSDSASSNMGGTDLWTNYTKLINGDGFPHSWVVLRFSGIGEKFEVCVDFNTSNGSAHLCTIVISPNAGFGSANGGTNGSTSARPTATDGYTYSTGGELVSGNTSTVSAHRAMFWGSSDNKCFYWCRAQDGGNWVWGFVGVPLNVAPEWTTGNHFVFGTQGAGAYCLRGNWVNAARTYAKINGTNALLFMTAEGVNGGILSQAQPYASDIPYGWPMIPTGLYSTTAGVRGRVGDMPDLWWGAEVGLQFTDCYPNDNTRRFIHLKDAILPWDGSVPSFV